MRHGMCTVAVRHRSIISEHVSSSISSVATDIRQSVSILMVHKVMFAVLLTHRDRTRRSLAEMNWFIDPSDQSERPVTLLRGLAWAHAETVFIRHLMICISYGDHLGKYRVHIANINM